MAAGLKAIAVGDGSEEAIALREAPQPRPHPDATKASGPAITRARAKTLVPRAGSKLARVIDLLQRRGGATIPTLIEATDWLPHTTRAALTGLRKRGYAIARERINGGNFAPIGSPAAHSGDRSVVPAERPRAATESVSRRRTKRRDRHGARASRIPTSSEATGEDDARALAAS